MHSLTINKISQNSITSFLSFPSKKNQKNAVLEHSNSGHPHEATINMHSERETKNVALFYSPVAKWHRRKPYLMLQ